MLNFNFPFSKIDELDFYHVHPVILSKVSLVNDYSFIISIMFSKNCVKIFLYELTKALFVHKFVRN
jgi:hypothetical protein